MLVILSIAAFAAAAVALPPSLAVPANASLILRAEGRGVQIYLCAANPDQPEHYDWRFVAPEAELFAADGGKVARHFAGPTWEGADGGQVVGEVRAKAPSPDPTAIDWLLLSARSANGAGVLGRASFVQRTQTVGGKAPAAGCAAAQSGQTLKVPYSAEYDFYGPR